MPTKACGNVIRSLILAALITFAGTAGATSWALINADSNVRRYLDVSSLRVEQGLVRLWIRSEYPQLQRETGVPDQFDERKSSIAVECQVRKYAVTATQFLNRGRSVFLETFSQWQFDEVPPDSIVELAFWAACDKTFFTIIAMLEKSMNLQESTIPGKVNPYFFLKEVGRTSRSRAMLNGQSINVLGDGLIAGMVSLEDPNPRQNRAATLRYMLWDCSQAGQELELATVELDSGWQISGAVVKTPDQWTLTPRRGLREQIWRSVCSGTTAPRSQKKAEGSRQLGTAWLTESGYFVTASHVVYGKKSITIQSDLGKVIRVNVVSVNQAADIAILAADGAIDGAVALKFAANSPSPGERVSTIGFPLPDVLGLTPKFAAGELSGEVRVGAGRSLYQITVPVQAGNSGGPLLSERGEVVGIVVSKLNAMHIFSISGDLPQNVNFAVFASEAAKMLETLPPVLPRPSVASGTSDSKQLARAAAKAVFVVVAD